MSWNFWPHRMLSPRASFAYFKQASSLRNSTRLLLEPLEERLAPAAAVRAVTLSDPAMLSDTSAGNSSQASTSADGRFTVFTSSAANVVPDQIKHDQSSNEIFLFDHQTGEVELISHQFDDPNKTSNGTSMMPTISANGNYIVFVSSADNLVEGQSSPDSGGLSALLGGATAVYLYDRSDPGNPNTSIISHTPDSTLTLANKASGSLLVSPSISADGRYTVYSSTSTNLVENQQGGGLFGLFSHSNVFVYDRVSDTNTMISHKDLTLATSGDGESTAATISEDGNTIAFVSFAPDLINGMTYDVHEPGTIGNVFVYQKTDGTNYSDQQGTLALVTHTAGREKEAAFSFNFNTLAPPVLTPDGGYVAYVTTQANIAAFNQDGEAGQDIVYLYDVSDGTNVIVSHAPNSHTTAASGSASGALSIVSTPSISDDGRYVAYMSDAHNIVEQQASNLGEHNVFLFDRLGADGLANTADDGVNALLTRNTTDGSGSGGLTPTISADGRFVAYAGHAAEQINGLTDGNVANGFDVLVYDRIGDTTALVSHENGSTTTTSNHNAQTPFISADNSIIVYLSDATNLVPTGKKDLNNGTDVFHFVLDDADPSKVGQTTTLTLRPDGLPSLTANDYSLVSPISSISDDGRYAVILSQAPNLLDGQVDANLAPDIFLYDNENDELTLISHAHDNARETANGASSNPVISADGGYVAFISLATNLIDGQTFSTVGPALYVYDVAVGSLQLATHAHDDTEKAANNQAGSLFSNPAISSYEGEVQVVYLSNATDLIADQTTSASGQDPINNVFLYDYNTNTNKLISHVADDTSKTANAGATSVTISGDGSTIAYSSGATNLIAEQEDANGVDDYFIYRNGANSLVTHNAEDSNKTADSQTPFSSFVFPPSLSANGQFLVYSSNAVDLVPDQDTSSETSFPLDNVFLYDSDANSNFLVSHQYDNPNVAGNHTLNIFQTITKSAPVISADGNYVAYASNATNLLEETFESNGADNVFLFDRIAGTNTRISTVSSSNPDDPSGMSPSISSDGSFVAFVDFAPAANDELDSEFPSADVRLYDRINETLKLISHLPDDENAVSFGIAAAPFLSGDGSTIAFNSTSTLLTDGDRNGQQDIFITYDDSGDGGGPGEENHPPVANDDEYSVLEDHVLEVSAAEGVLANDFDPDGDDLIAILVTTTSHGELVLSEDGSFVYTPNEDYNGVDIFTYKANDGEFDSNIATVTINVIPVNDPPVASDDEYSTDEDITLNVSKDIGILVNDFDVDGDELTAILVTGPSHGTLTLNDDGSFQYIPDKDYNGIDTYTYVANDGEFDSNVATVTINVIPVNDPPVAFDDEYSTDEDITLNVSKDIGILVNDFDVDGDELTAILVTGPSHGTLTLNDDGSFQYIPDKDYNGIDTYTYVANDGEFDSNVATVTINVIPVNDPPVAFDDEYSTDEDITLNVSKDIGILVNDFDVDGDELTAILVTGPSHGTLTLNDDGSFQYIPDQDYNGADVFTYKANDGEFDSNVATVTINIIPVNDPPVAIDDEYSTLEDITLNVAKEFGILVNDFDVEGDILTAILVSGPSNGTLTLNDDGSFQYTPDQDYNGTDVFTYIANDGEFDSNIATVTINVIPVNDPPIAFDDEYSTDEDIPLNVSQDIGILVNDFDVDGDELSAILVTGPSHGTLTLNGDGSFQYTPDQDYNGTDFFTYKANDGEFDSNIATVTINVIPVNDPPVAFDDAYGTFEDIPLNVIREFGVLVNDFDVDGDLLTAILVSGPSNGALSLNGDGAFQYIPNPDYFGTDFFTYIANDGEFDSNIATVFINVLPVNDPPIAFDDEYSTDEDITLNVPAELGILINDFDIDGDNLIAILFTGPSNGTLTLNGNGSFEYTPDSDFHGSDAYTYFATDGLASSNIATVNITVHPVNDPPVAFDDKYEVDEGEKLVIEIDDGVLVNDEDADGDDLKAVLAVGPNNGELEFEEDGSFTYTPDVDFNGTDEFTYRANDGLADSNIATVTITVNPKNDLPDVDDDDFDVDEDNMLVVAAAQGVLANDRDEDGDELTAKLVDGPENGMLTLNADGSFTYTPDEDFNGEDTFTYQADDGLGLSDVATVTIVVDPVNDAPVAEVDAYFTNEDEALLVDAVQGVLANDLDVDGDPLTAVLVAGPLNGQLLFDDNGSFTYIPNANYFGFDNFSYFTTDGQLNSDIAVVTINVFGVDDVPQNLRVAPAAAEAAPNTEVGELSATSPDGPRDFDFSFVAGTNDNDLFRINGNFLFTGDNFADGSRSSYTVDIRATDTVNGLFTDERFTITVSNFPPAAVDDVFSTDEDMILNVPADSGVLANDTDNDGDELFAVLVSGPSHGTLTLNSDGSFTYDPDDDYNGEDSFTYKAVDGALESDVATVTITVNPINDTPVAEDDAYLTNEDETLLVDGVQGVLANDFDVDGDPLTAMLVAGPLHGQLLFDANGSFTYIPNANYFGFDNFSYFATDGQLDSDIAVVTINVFAVDDQPANLGLTSSTAAGAPNFNVGTLFVTSPDGPRRFVFSFAPGANDNSLFQINGNTLLTGANFPEGGRATYAVDIRATDTASGLSTVERFVISVSNFAPTNITLTNAEVNAGDPPGSLVGMLAAVDSDGQPGSWTYTLLDGAENFAVVGNQLVTNAAFSNTLPAEFTIRVLVSDAGGLSFAQTFAITVNPLTFGIPDSGPPSNSGNSADSSNDLSDFVSAVQASSGTVRIAANVQNSDAFVAPVIIVTNDNTVVAGISESEASARGNGYGVIEADEEANEETGNETGDGTGNNENGNPPPDGAGDTNPPPDRGGENPPDGAPANGNGNPPANGAPPPPSNPRQTLEGNSATGTDGVDDSRTDEIFGQRNIYARLHNVRSLGNNPISPRLTEQVFHEDAFGLMAWTWGLGAATWVHRKDKGTRLRGNPKKTAMR